MLSGKGNLISWLELLLFGNMGLVVITDLLWHSRRNDRKYGNLGRDSAKVIREGWKAVQIGGVLIVVFSWGCLSS